MAKITSFSNQKGGVGKTTTCVNLASYIASMGKKVLLLDLDPQGNASTGLGINKTAVKKSSYNLLLSDYDDINQMIFSTPVENLKIIPSNIDLAGAEVEIVNLPQRDRLLKKSIQLLSPMFDYIMIDCPPSLGLLTINALSASDSVLIPIQSEFYALEGLTQLMNTLRLVMKHLNPTLELEGVVLTMHDTRSLMSRQVAEEIQRYFGEKVYAISIPRNIRLSEAPSHGVPIMLHDKRCSGAKAYHVLANEFIKREKKQAKLKNQQ